MPFYTIPRRYVDAQQPKQAISSTDAFIEPNCQESLKQSFNESSLINSLKLIKDSSHSLNKLGSYQDCIYKVYYSPINKSLPTNIQNYTYLLFYTPSPVLNIKPTLFSVCIPEIPECSESD